MQRQFPKSKKRKRKRNREEGSLQWTGVWMSTGYWRAKAGGKEVVRGLG